MRSRLAILFCLVVFGPANAETRALLIGVSDYNNTFGIDDLKGPINDVRLIQSVLNGSGISEITMLADGVDGAVRPTRTAILEAFAQQAEIARAGDFVYIHLSGHGTRQKDQNGDESDGLDEVFLPADTGRAEPGNGAIPNALIDDEIGEAVRAIRLAGADVWLVMDSCFSGSGLRGSIPKTATRFVKPEVLGLDISTPRLSEKHIVESSGPDPAGGYLAFYSANSTEVAHELDMSAEGEDEKWFGLFTSKLAVQLGDASGISFRQLFQSVMLGMNDTNLPGGARMQTPIWEGDLIDTVVFGGRKTVGLKRFAVSDDQLSAGKLHGFSDGTLVALVANATDGANDILGYAQVEIAGATTSFMRPVSPECLPLTDQPCDSETDFPEGANFAQLAGHPVDNVLRIAWPRDVVTGDRLAPESNIVRSLFDASANLDAKLGIAVEISDTGYAVETIWDGQKLWFGPRAIEGQSLVGLAWDPANRELAVLLERIATAEKMSRTFEALAGAGSILSPNPVSASAELNISAIDALVGIGSPVPPAEECAAVFAASQGTKAQPMPQSADLKQCDQIDFTVQGKFAGLRDVNRIHIDAEYCIHAAYERIVDDKTPQRLGSPLIICSDCPGGYSAGEERLFVVVTESEPNSEALNLQGLVENCDADSTSRGAHNNPALDYLATIGQRPDRRRSSGGLGISDVWVEQFNWRVLPRREAFVRSGRSLVPSE